MQKGDISNEFLPRFLFVFEGLVARLPSRRATQLEWAMCRSHQWKRAAKLWVINDNIKAHLWDITWRYDYRFDIVTFHDDGFVPALEERLDRENIPYGNCFASTPDGLSHLLPRMPDVNRVFFADEALMFRFGHQGRLVRFEGVGFSPWV